MLVSVSAMAQTVRLDNNSKSDAASQLEIRKVLQAKDGGVKAELWMLAKVGNGFDASKLKAQGIMVGSKAGDIITLRLTADKVGPSPLMDRDEALMHLTRKYFQCRQPATLEDFVWWSGFNIGDCRRGIALLGDTLHLEKWKGREFYLTDDCRTRGFRQDRFLLIPPYDEYLIGYKSRDIVLLPEHRHHAHNNSGIFKPIVACSGIVCGNWEPFKDDCNATFFKDDHSSEELAGAWQTYTRYRSSQP